MIAVVIPLSLSRLADHCVAGAVITVMPEITALKGQLFERNNENCCPFSAVIFAEGVAG
jgi:hypothetical protein